MSLEGSQKNHFVIRIVTLGAIVFLGGCETFHTFVSPEEVRARKNACRYSDLRSDKSLHRLSQAELENAVADGLGLAGPFYEDLPADQKHHFFYAGETLEINTDFVEQTLGAAEHVANALSISNQEGANIVLSCSGGSACAISIVQPILERFFGRPANAEELSLIAEIVDTTMVQGQGSFEDGLRVAIRWVLSSPNFTFRVEEKSATGKLDSFDLARRMAAFLWKSIPDDQLLNLARLDTLSETAVFRAEIERMMADPKFDRFIRYMANEWLADEMTNVQPDPTLYPGWDPALLAKMDRETELFLGKLVRDNEPLKKLLTANYTFVDDQLAAHYGLPAPGSSSHQLVSLIGIPERKGLLQQGSFLVKAARHDEGSVTARGLAVMEKLTCDPPNPPSPAVVAGFPVLPQTDPATGRRLSLREKLGIHRAQPACAGCHAVMDPVGFALHHFGPDGVYRSQDPHGNTINATGTYFGHYFDDSTDLADAIVTGKNYSECVTSMFIAGGIGMAIDIKSDQDSLCKARSIAESIGGSEGGFKDLIVNIMEDRVFQENSVK